MKNLFAVSAFLFGLGALVPAASAGDKCDEVTLLSVSDTKMPTKGGWTSEREARFMRTADSVIMQMRLRPQQLSDADVRRAMYDHGPHFRLCSISGKVDILPVLE